MTCKTESGSNTRYTQDFLQQETKVEVGVPAACASGGGTSTYTYSYDGTGRRIKTYDGATTSYFMYSGQTTMLYSKVINGGTTETAYVYVAGKLLLSKDTSDARYYHQDISSNVRAVTYYTSSIQVYAKYRYRPFGDYFVLSGTLQRFQFAQQEYDSSVRQYHMGLRYQDSVVGRFVQRDPIGPGYDYGYNNPLSYRDPSGMTGECSWNPLTWGNCLSGAGSALAGGASAVGGFLYENTVGAATNSYNWYTHASASDQRAFWIGVLTAVAIGVAVGASCVFLGCAGLVLLAVGIGTSIGGSFAAGGVYKLAGGQSEGGLQATMFWGGIGAGAGFAAGAALASPAAELGEEFLETQSRLDNLLEDVSEDVRANPEDYLSSKQLADQPRINAHMGTAIHEELAQRVADDPFLSIRLAYNRVGPDFTYLSSENIYLEVTTPGQVTAHTTRFIQQGITGMVWYLTY